MNKNLKIGLLIGCLLAASGVGWQMFTLAGKQQLWGHLPLFALLSGWIFILLLWEKRISKHTNKYRLLGLALLSGVLLSVGFPPMPLLLTMFVGFMPLLWVEHQIVEAKLEKTSKEVFKYSFVAFVTWNILTTWWVANASFVSALVAIGLNSLFMTIPFVGYHRIRQRFTAPNILFAFAGFWLTYEYLHARWDLSWPWLTLGNSLAEYPILAQWYDITGVSGGSLWILLVNFYLFEAFKKYKSSDNTGWKKEFIFPLLLLIIPSIWSIIKYTTYETDKNAETINVVAVQPNHEPHYLKPRTPERLILDKSVRLALEKIDSTTDYLVLPETTFGVVWHETVGRDDIVAGLRNLTERYPNLKIVAGLTSLEKLKDPKNLPSTARTYGRKDNIQFYYNAYNSAVQVEKNQSVVPFHIKAKQVPGAELMPFPWLLGFLEPVFASFGGTTAGMGMPKELVIFPFDNGKKFVGTAICYESVYGEYMTKQVQKGANALFIITNDGWWDNSAGHKQHLRFASLRAIETRRSIARSANTGISCFVNQRGDIQQATTYEEDAAIQTELPLNDKITPYTKYGDLIGRVAGFITLMLGFSGIAKRFTK